MTFGPPDTDWPTLFETSGVPSAQLVLVTVPAAESTVVVPDALQVHVGDVLKFAAHWLTSTFTDGGKIICVQPASVPPSGPACEPPVHAPDWQVAPFVHAKLEPQPPQLLSSACSSTQRPSQAL
jgi:hypothetical protein